jgi:hypothetical protein
MSTTTITIDSAGLLPDLQRLVKDLKADLLDRLREHPEIDADLRVRAYAPVERGGRTAQAYEVWRDDYLEQVAVAWILACVFVRYMEDNDLIAGTYLAGTTPDQRRQADDAHTAYFQAHPRDSDREYLLDVFRRVGSIPAARDLFAEGKTPLWAVGPSGDGAARLLAFWRAIDPETGALRRSFRAEGGDTRFLGDLYQDLSEAARKKYALLQTPEFVEEFILDHTLTPALDEFGLEAVRLIDPTCGSGHFLLGAFRRLFRLWSEREPGTEPAVLVQRALDAVAGVDVNPFAVAIARFRLIVEAMTVCGVRRLDRATGWTIRVAVGDSLMHGDTFDRRGFRQEWLPSNEPWSDPLYAMEDPAGLGAILNRQYHAVIGNPPYITVKDAKLNDRYRARWGTCHRQYSLGVPFTERFFDLALSADGPRPAGYVGMITANSFMKREFGKKLIEDFFPKVDLTHVIDTSGAYIPGHGTPTVILLGRNRKPPSSEVRAALGIRGEPSTPDDPAQGKVWRAIVDHLDNGQAQNEFVTVTNVTRSTFAKHPWSIGGGGAADLKEQIEQEANSRVCDMVDEVGFGAVTREDGAFLVSERVAQRHRVPSQQIRPLVVGEQIRDWSMDEPQGAIWPYDPDTLEAFGPVGLQQFLWHWRTQLSDRVAYGSTQLQRGLNWFEYSMFFRDRFRTPLSIAFASIATHNHFVLDWGGKVFTQSAPIIKLPADATEDDHLALLGLLNSSTACFWMKQVFFPKGGSGIGRGITDESWEMRYEHDGTKLEAFPILGSRTKALPLARELDILARRIVELSPAELVKREVPTADRLAANRAETERLQSRMVALQEELDWLCYRLYGRMEPTETPDGGHDEPYRDPPGLQLGERAFEIAMAWQMAAEELQTSWFERHGSTPISEIPAHWPEAYRALVQRRLDAIRDNPNISLIERPEYKRRWLREPWDDQVRRALRSWLLDRLESDCFWPDPAHAPPELTSTAVLAERAQHDPEFLQIAALYAGRPDFPLPKLFAELVAAESVPFLPVLRYKPSGLIKREVWERTWDLQRREDAGEDVGTIPVPPKYASADFLTSAFWRLRGKLDVPKERFLSYPHCSRDGDPSLVVGWAGWDHLRQAQALTAYYERMKSREGWHAERLVPLLAGLVQLVPWLLQWHNDLDPEYDLRMGDYYRDFVRDEAQALGFTLDQVRAWGPPAKSRGGRTRKAP